MSKSHAQRSLSRCDHGFTLVELLAATAVLVLLMSILLLMITAVNRQVATGGARSESFRAARNAFELLTRKISQATLNTYWDYDDPANPTRYQRESELRFISGEANSLIDTLLPDAVTHCIFFQAPLGQVDTPSLRPLDSLISTTGFYVERNSDRDFLPTIPGTDDPLPGLAERVRYRLMELREPSEDLVLYEYTSGDKTYTGRDWFLEPLDVPANRQIVGENIVAMLIMPKLSQQDLRDSSGNLASDADTKLLGSGSFLYDTSSVGQGNVKPLFNSRHQLPPLVQVTIVAIDETSAARLESGIAPPLDYTDLFEKPEDLEADLIAFEDQLIANNLSYRIFNTDVQILSSKWSVEE